MSSSCNGMMHCTPGNARRLKAPCLSMIPTESSGMLAKQPIKSLQNWEYNGQSHRHLLIQSKKSICGQTEARGWDHGIGPKSAQQCAECDVWRGDEGCNCAASPSPPPLHTKEDSLIDCQSLWLHRWFWCVHWGMSRRVLYFFLSNRLNVTVPRPSRVYSDEQRTGGGRCSITSMTSSVVPSSTFC